MQSVEERLKLAYTEPTLPTELEQFYTPSPNEKAFEQLRDGETQIDMHRYYRGFHRAGWDDAITEFGRDASKREFKTARDVRMAIPAMKIGCDAYWIGYDEAYRQIAAADAGI